MLMLMEMYFYWSMDVKYLCEGWRTNGHAGPYLACLFGTMLMAWTVEFLSTLKLKNDLVMALLHGVRLFLSYMLMLVAMTFNGGLVLAIIFALTSGYLLFGFKPIVLSLKTTYGTSNQVYSP